MVDLRELSLSNDYLLALGSTRSVSNDSEKIYDDIQWLLDEETKVEETKEEKKATKKKPSKKKNDKATLSRHKAVLPILPKPPAVPDKESLSRRLDALGNVTTEDEREQARKILSSADEFILSHFDDALKELETGKQGTTSKLKLLLDIYSSLNVYLAPIYKLQQQIQDKTREAVEKRNEHDDEHALNLMREIKQLEFKLAHLRDDLANQVGLPADATTVDEQGSASSAIFVKEGGESQRQTTTSTTTTTFKEAKGPVVVTSPST